MAATLSILIGRFSEGRRELRRQYGAAPVQVIGAKMALEMRLPKARKPLSESLGRDSKKHLVVPGDTITTDTGFMRYVRIWGSQGLRRRLHSSLHVARCPGTHRSIHSRSLLCEPYALIPGILSAPLSVPDSLL